MKKITLNLEQIKNKEDLYAVLEKKTASKVENLDGLYQYFSGVTEPVTLTLTGVGAFKNEMGNYAGSFLKIVDKAGKRNPQVKVKLIYAASEKKHTEKEKASAGKNTDSKNTAGKQKKEGCPYAKKCGGCSGQVQSYSQELAEKQKWLDRILGTLGNVDDILPMQNPLHYRHKVHAVFSHDRKGNILAGVYEEKSHRVVDIESCRIENEEAGRVIRTIKDMCRKYRMKAYDEDTGMGFLRHVLIRSSYQTGEMLVVLVTGNVIFPAKKQFVKELTERYPKITSIVMNVNNKKTSMVLGEKEVILYGKGYVEDELCKKRFRISSKSFYQVNPEQTQKLYRIAVECAGLTGKERVIDAYCGTGTIGIVAAQKAGSVIGVELNKDAIRDAKVNAKMNGIDNIRFYQADATRFMSQMAVDGEKADVVFLDPPRSGSTEECLDAVDKLSPERIVYVSCNPETLQRDVLYLMKKQYRMTACKPVDLFPWTKHVECVVLMTRCGFEEK